MIIPGQLWAAWIQLQLMTDEHHSMPRFLEAVVHHKPCLFFFFR